MTSIFISGSRSISKMNAIVQRELSTFISVGHTILIGDAYGVDKMVQSFLAQAKYRNVRVFCVDGICRNNIGDWEIISVKSDSRKRDFAFYALKDIVMADISDFGFVVWDGKSKGSLSNINNLLKQNKLVLIYLLQAKRIFRVTNAEKLGDIINSFNLEIAREINDSLIEKSKQRALHL